MHEDKVQATAVATRPPDEWPAIGQAVQTVKTGVFKRVEGETWMVYAVGSSVIRVDLKT